MVDRTPAGKLLENLIGFAEAEKIPYDELVVGLSATLSYMLGEMPYPEHKRILENLIRKMQSELAKRE